MASPLPRRTLRSAADLVAAGLLPADLAADIADVARRYAVAVTPAVADLMDRTDPADPIARQFVPDVRERTHHPAELADPIGDHDKSPVKGIVHRYPDRVLLKVVGVCPVYCRFCFRREMVGPASGTSLGDEELAAALDYIRTTPTVWEVILTGGDPFMLAPRRARDITVAIGAIPHVGALRWHTRVPVADPDRVTDDLVAALRASAKAVTVGVHVNHPRELSAEARAALARLADGGIPLLGQTVLLKGVNDDADTLEALMRNLVASRVKPYYLHHGDLAPGTGHFRVPIARGQALASDLRRRLSGVALPAYVLDIPGGHGKVPLTAEHVTELAPGRYLVRDRHGVEHPYDDCC